MNLSNSESECNANQIIFLSLIVLRMERRLPMLITARLCYVFQALTVKPGKSSILGYHNKKHNQTCLDNFFHRD
jgi:hypothetical protein